MPVRFQSPPYDPSEKMPTASTPQTPQVPCTETAPTGSSTPRRSKNQTDSTTSTPATMPTMAAAQGWMNAHGAVMPTSPASMPLAIMPGSGFLVRSCVHSMAMTAPNAAAVAVFVAMTAKRWSVAASVDAALNPNQPNRRMNVP